MSETPLLRPFQPADDMSPRRRGRMEATAVALRYLHVRWPHVFAKTTTALRPLAIGDGEKLIELAAADPSAPEQKWIRRAIAVWCGSSEYVSALARGEERVSLDGTVSPPSIEHVQAARVRWAAMRERSRAKARARKQCPQDPAVPAAALPSGEGPKRPTLTLRRRSA
jgi:sRNA-binding protein